MDGIMLMAVAQELEEKLRGARIHKIYQHSGAEITMLFRRPGESFQLLLAGGSQHPRVYLTETDRKNPRTPPGFCMLLRKYLESSRLLSIKQPGLERVLEFSFEPRVAEKGTIHPLLILEIMGRHSNLMLVDDTTRTILGSLKLVSSQMSRYRQVAPGLPYLPPPAHGKLDLSRQEVPNVDFALNHKSFMENLAGIGPHSARELVHRCQIQGMQPTLQALAEQIKEGSFTPTVLWDDYGPVGISALSITYYQGQVQTFASPNNALDVYYHGLIKKRELAATRDSLIQIIEAKLHKIRRKLTKQQASLAKAQLADEEKIKGELVMANLHLIKKGQDHVIVNNFYNENKPIKIPLDLRYDGPQNGQNYFKRYRKSKKTQVAGGKQVKKTQEEQAYWEDLLEIVTAAGLPELLDIQKELAQEQPKKKKDSISSSPRQFRSRDGHPIYVGRNSRQNDRLVRMAHPQDLWLHTKDIPGSHVIIPSKGQSLSPETLEDAALLAAYYSASRQSSKVPVDYTQVKHVRKAPGAAPGMVIYDHQKTVFVTPSPELLPPEKK